MAEIANFGCGDSLMTTRKQNKADRLTTTENEFKGIIIGFRKEQGTGKQLQ